MNEHAILIVRPSNRQAEDIQTCRAFGYQGIGFSPLMIQTLPENQEQLIHTLTHNHATFWVSPTAVEIAHHFSGSLKTYTQPHIAVGQATALALKKAGAQNILFDPNHNDSEAVLHLPIWSNLPKNALIGIIAGENGRDFLLQNLEKRGFTVALCPIYQRHEIPLNWSIFQAAQPIAAWVTSAQQAKLLFAQSPSSLTQTLQTLLYFTHHERIRAALNASGAHTVFLVKDLNQALNLLNNQEIFRLNGEHHERSIQTSP